MELLALLYRFELSGPPMSVCAGVTAAPRTCRRSPEPEVSSSHPVEAVPPSVNVRSALTVLRKL